MRYGSRRPLRRRYALLAERSLAIRGAASWRFLVVAVIRSCSTRSVFVYALELTTAATTALHPGTTPVFTALFRTPSASSASDAPYGSRLRLAVGVALVAPAREATSRGLSVGTFSGSALRDVGGVLGCDRAADADTRRTGERGRPPAAWVPLSPSAGRRRRPGLRRSRLGGVALFLLRDVGPLVLTNVLWFTSIGRVGPSHAGDLREPPAVRRSASSPSCSSTRRSPPRRWRGAADRARDPRRTRAETDGRGGLA